MLREFCSVDARILPQDNGCIFLFKAEKESLPGNRKFNLATFRPIRSHAVELRYIAFIRKMRYDITDLNGVKNIEPQNVMQL